MRCCYCQKNVVGQKDVVMVVGEGPAHQSCHDRYTLTKRQFGNLDLQKLEDDVLNELKELVLTEWNARQKSAIEDDIELFA